MSKAAKDSTYNGWKNWETWNVALWIGNDEGFYQISRRCRSYQQWQDEMDEIGNRGTPDGVDWHDKALDTEALDDMLNEE
jgi:hypothetical protein